MIRTHALHVVKPWKYYTTAGLWSLKKRLFNKTFGVNFNFTNEINYPCDWLAGGCVLHHSNQVYLDNFYPFEGKAYSEDLFHSFYLKKSGINLYSNTKTFCYLDWPPEPRTRLVQREEKNVLKYFIKLSGRSLLRFKIYNYYIFLIKVLNYLKKLKFTKKNHK